MKETLAVLCRLCLICAFCEQFLRENRYISALRLIAALRAALCIADSLRTIF